MACGEMSHRRGMPRLASSVKSLIPSQNGRALVHGRLGVARGWLAKMLTPIATMPIRRLTNWRSINVDCGRSCMPPIAVRDFANRRIWLCPVAQRARISDSGRERTSVAMPSAAVDPLQS